MSRLIKNLRKLKKYKKLSSDLEYNISMIKNYNFYAVFMFLFYSLYYLILPTNDIIVNSYYLLLFFSIINSIHLIINIFLIASLLNFVCNGMIKIRSYLLKVSIVIFFSFFAFISCLLFLFLGFLSVLLLLFEPVNFNVILDVFNFLPLYYFLCSPLFILFFILSYRTGDKKIKLNKTRKLKNEIDGKISNIIEENEKFKSDKIELIKATNYLKTKNVIGSDIFNLNEYLDDIEINKSTEISLDNQCKLDYITNNNLLKKDIKIEND